MRERERDCFVWIFQLSWIHCHLVLLSTSNLTFKGTTSREPSTKLYRTFQTVLSSAIMHFPTSLALRHLEFPVKRLCNRRGATCQFVLRRAMQELYVGRSFDRHSLWRTHSHQTIRSHYADRGHILKTHAWHSAQELPCSETPCQTEGSVYIANYLKAAESLQGSERLWQVRSPHQHTKMRPHAAVAAMYVTAEYSTLTGQGQLQQGMSMDFLVCSTMFN